jgi:hypothetical protein
MSELLVTSYSEIFGESMGLQPQLTPEMPCERYSNTYHALDNTWNVGDIINPHTHLIKNRL